MATAEIIMGEIGGGSNVSYVPDTGNLIHSINTSDSGVLWTATEDCVMVGTATATGGWATQIFVNTSTEDNDKTLIGGPSSGTIYIGGTTNDTTGIFIAKGTQVLIRSHGSYNLKFYKPLYS